MRTTCNALYDFSVMATDGELGRVKDIYFDDESWNIRYLVVDTRKWLAGRKVLLTPQSIARIDVRERQLHFDLTTDQIRRSPSLNEHLPLTRAHEIALHEFFGWNHYWTYGGMFDFRLPISDNGVGEGIPTVGEERRAMANIHQIGEPHLASCKDLLHFEIQLNPEAKSLAKPEVYGELWDFVVSADEWNLPFFVVEDSATGGSRKVVLPTSSITVIDAEDMIIRASAPGVAAAPAIEEFNQLGGGI